MLSRRRFLLGTGAAAVLAACGDGGDDGSDGAQGTDGTGTTAAGSSLVLGEAFDRNALLVAGIPQRAPFVLFEESGGLVTLDDAPSEITFTLTPEGGAALAPLATARRGDDIDRPYYPLLTTFPAPGAWMVTADLGDGRTLESAVVVNEGPTVPQVGEPLPIAPSPTTANPLGVARVCTEEPPCPFHEVSLDAAVAAGRPITVLVSTPEFCQVGICGPVLGLLVDAAAQDAGRTTIHVEVYPQSAAGDPGPVSPLVVDTFGLSYEPVLFVTDAAGTITARLDNIYDGTELAEALATASG
jgi:hypothetical protein